MLVPGRAAIDPTERLLDRHVACTRTPAQASEKVTGSDLRNADLVAASWDRADLVLAAVGQG
ncbi:hypothetical protein ACFXOT_39890, partial [Streptomyces anulatus]